MGPKPPRAVTPALIAGIVIIFLGCLFLLENMGLRFSHYVLNFWPAIPLAFGIVKLVQSRGQSTWGLVLTAGGALLLLKTLGISNIEDFIGPILLLATGIFIVLHALKKQRQVPPELQHSTGFLRGHAILSSFLHQLPAQPFQGGEITAIFGGMDVDFRQARMEQPSARLDVFVLFGGGELRVPEGWEVMVQTTSIFGGVSDKGRARLPQEDGPRPCLVLTGLVLFGGLEIKN